MTDRSRVDEVRNPVLKLKSVRKFQALPPDVQALVVEFLGDLTGDARERAQKSWKQNKGPMALYWKVVGAYSHHLRCALRRRTAVQSKLDDLQHRRDAAARLAGLDANGNKIKQDY